jgi:hypothetical protein
MGISLGLNAELYYGVAESGAHTLIENVKDLTLNLEKAEADVTTRANDGWRATVGTLKDASIEFQMVHDSGDAAFLALRSAFMDGTPLDFRIMSGGDDSEGLLATCEVMNFTRNEALEEAIMYDVTIKPTYAANPPQWIGGGGSDDSSS